MASAPSLFSRIRSVVPILEWLPAYRASWLRGDCVAGITLAAYAVPVSLAYAALAGLPAQAGLYCYVLGGVAYCAFGRSRQLAIGPTSAISILIGASLAGMSQGDPARLATLAMHTAILTGLIGLAAWAFRLGNVVNFVSETILSGFRVGAGLVIASTQLPKLFGMGSSGDDFFTRIFRLAANLGHTSVPSLIVGLAAVVLLFGGDRLLPKRPIALFVVALSLAFMAYFPDLGREIKTVGQIPQGLPHFAWPVVQWREVDDLLALAMACFLLSYVEGISVARTFALKHRYSVDPDQELLALGATNLVAGLGQGYPVAGGMSQSAVNEKAGARTPLALLFASATICVVLLYFTGLLQSLPQPVLAAVVLFAVRGLIGLGELRHLRRVSPFEFSIAMVAMVGVLLFGILKGVLLSVLFSILLLLKRASRPRIAVLGRLPGTDRFVDVARYPEQQPIPGMVLLRVESGLFYFNAETVKNAVLGSIRSSGSTATVVLDLSTSPNIDIAGARMLRDLHEELEKDGTTLVLAEVHGYLRDVLWAEELQDRILGIQTRLGIAQLVDQPKSTAVPA